jgi:hypothetical protein
MEVMDMGYIGAFFSFFNLGIIVLVAGVSIYIYVLLIKLMRRGIKALDIHLEEKSRTREY